MHDVRAKLVETSFSSLAVSFSDRNRGSKSPAAPCSASQVTTAATIGVLPVPPAVRLPMLTTGTGARWIRKRSQSNARFRRADAGRIRKTRPIFNPARAACAVAPCCDPEIKSR